MPGPFFFTRETREQKSARAISRLFEDDKLEDKNPSFDPDLVDSRPYGDEPDNLWQINASAAVVGLDIRKASGTDERFLFTLHPSYADAIISMKRYGRTIVPSLGVLNGKAKQFDDGLYAELDSAMTAHKMKGFHNTSEMVKEILAKLAPTSDAHAWVWGGLDVGGFLSGDERKNPPARAAEFTEAFDRNEVESKPIGFYTWSPELQRTFRFLRYFQKEWVKRDGVPNEIAAVMAANPDIMAKYERMLDFYAHLTNPFDSLSFKALAEPADKGKTIEQIWKENQDRLRGGRFAVSFLPYSRSKEVTLFNRLFSTGLPKDADLMMELVRAIREGKVDLKPGEASGWYDYQVYALETFLLPERGKEHDKLLLTKEYKERMLQAFKAMITKRRETHLRQLSLAKGERAPHRPPPSKDLAPRLRVEPNPTFYIRSARAYAFLQAYLEYTIPENVWAHLIGRKEGGERAKPLREELEWMRNFFYGMHLISCEDIGMRPFLLEGELDVPDTCLDIASHWLESWHKDPDLAVDTRVAVPIYVDYGRERIKLWATLGVRGLKLKTWYAKPPKWRPVNQEIPSAWQDARTAPVEYLILTDEFAEVQLKGLRALSREELREICDKYKTKRQIVRALSRLK